MPTPLILKFSKESGRSVEEVEDLWNKAKAIAAKKFPKKTSDFYAYTVGILENMLSLSAMESTSIGGFYRESGNNKIALSGVVTARKAFGKKRTKFKPKKDKSGKTWWDRMSKKQQMEYLKEHPKSAAKLKLVVKEEDHEEVEKPEPTTESILPEKNQDTSPEATEEEPVEDTGTTEEQQEEPQTLEEITPRNRGMVHRAVNDGLSKLSHVVKEKKITFKKGLGALKDYGEGKRLSEEDKEHLKDVATILMGVTLVAAVAFLPISNYSGALASMYLDYLNDRKEKRKEREEDHEPVSLNEPELEGMTGEEIQQIQHVSTDMADWIMDQDPESLIDKAKHYK